MNKFVKQGKVRTVNGSILAPQGGGLKLVLSTATTNGGLDCPMMPVFKNKWSKFRENLFKIASYRDAGYGLGYVTELAVQSDVWLMHLMCRDDAGSLNEDGLKKCLKKIAELATYEKATVHVSDILTDAYPELVNLLNTEILQKGIDVVSYVEPQ